MSKHFRNAANNVLMITTIYFVLANVVWAHGGLVRSEPPVGSVLIRAPSEIKLYFSEKIEDAYSFVHVLDSNGDRVDKDDSHVDRSYPVLLRASLHKLKVGTYTVNWRVLSVDSHVTEGSFTYSIQ